jgi:uncharacterized protein
MVITMNIPRTIQKDIEKSLFKGKVVVLYGARRVGKTTLVKEIQKKFDGNSQYFNCDEPDIRNSLINKASTELQNLFGKNRLVILDEAQRIPNIGLVLKLAVDTFPNVQIIATGSSSFDLSNKVVEPLTGRKYEFYLHPLSLQELGGIQSKTDIKRLLETRIVRGMYPEIVKSEAGSEETALYEMTKSYLYKDILQFDRIRNSEAIEKLLVALALQIGNEVSYNELGATVGINKKTVQNYIKILEQAFVLFRISPLSRNLRNELTKLRKIYFYDTGIRNALIRNLNPLNLRQDTGALWENFVISERVKYNANTGKNNLIYFWRTKEGREIDYIEESEGAFIGFECKWQEKSYNPPQLFLRAYSNSTVNLITRENFLPFVGL